MGWNPANWQITDSFQGQSGGINPLKAIAKYTSPAVFLADAAKDSIENPNYQAGSGPSVAQQYPGVNTLGVPGSYSNSGHGGQDTTSQTSTGGGGGYSNYDAVSAAEALGIINSANQGLSRLAGQRATGQNNISNAYNDQYNDVNTRYGRDRSDYLTNKTQTQNDQIAAKNQINAGVRSKANSLQRLLGAYGAGSSDAAERYAPYLAARQGSEQRQAVNDKFARNLSALDTNWGRADEDYKGVFADLIKQRDTQFRDYDAQALQQEAQLRGQIAQAQAAKRYAETGNRSAAQAIIDAAQPNINNIYAQIDRLAATNPVYKQADVAYEAPNLEQYTYDDSNYLEAAQTPSGVSPYFWGYFNQDDQNQLGY